jgi:hypothetical protein
MLLLNPTTGLAFALVWGAFLAGKAFAEKRLRAHVVAFAAVTAAAVAAAGWNMQLGVEQPGAALDAGGLLARGQAIGMVALYGDLARGLRALGRRRLATVRCRSRAGRGAPGRRSLGRVSRTDPDVEREGALQPRLRAQPHARRATLDPLRADCVGALLTPDYLAMTSYARSATTRDSLFCVATFDRSFRAWAGRALIPAPEEWVLALGFAGIDPAIRDLSDRLSALRDRPANALRLASEHGADFGVVCGNPDTPYPPIYSNASFTIFDLRGDAAGSAAAEPSPREN